MKAASIHEIKKELEGLPPKKVVEICLRLARFKKENKDLLHYVLFEATDPEAYVRSLKKDIDDKFADVPLNSWFNTKRVLRGILTLIRKHSRYMASKEAEIDLLVYFCQSVKSAGIPYQKYPVLQNIYDTQVKKIGKLIATVHEDLQRDYTKQLEPLVDEQKGGLLQQMAKVVRLKKRG